MQYLKQIVNAINTNIATVFTDVRFGGSEYNGICILANNDGKLMPLSCDNYDDEKWVGPDDTFPIRIYHRTLAIGYVDEPTKSYGNDGNTSKRETAQMTLVAYANRNAVRMTPEELEGAIMSGIPSAISNATAAQLKLKSCTIIPVACSVDPVAVYLAETKAAMYDLPPNTLLIRINYNIVSTYKTACFNLCDC